MISVDAKGQEDIHGRQGVRGHFEVILSCRSGRLQSCQSKCYPFLDPFCRLEQGLLFSIEVVLEPELFCLGWPGCKGERPPSD